MRDRQGRGGRDRRFDDKPKTGSDKDLLQLLRGLNGNSYGAYKRAIGKWNYGKFTVHLDRVQSDPYAPPSALRITSTPQAIGLPEDTFATPEQQLATADFLLRSFGAIVRADRRFSAISVVSVGQEVLERSAASVTENQVELRIQVSMPARGRTILGHQAATIFDADLPTVVEEVFDFTSPASTEHVANLISHVETYQDYLELRRLAEENNWVAFVADGAILPRRSGISQLPMEDAVPFESPDSLRQSATLPFAGTVWGMAIPPGITMIVGGGYNGKSTVLSAIERGVYAHVPGDGRELVVASHEAMKVRAADGRPITKVDVSPFINHLPTGSDTTSFSTQNASGSTSQAASLIEAIQAGSSLLLLDEDTSATNLMIRDERMRALVAASQEPITPLIDRIVGMYQETGASVILVMGGSGAYLDVCDLVLQMDAYKCQDVTARAEEVAKEFPQELTQIPSFPELTPRMPIRLRPTTGRAKTRAGGLDALTIDKHTVNLTDVEQVVEPGQTEAIAWALRGILQELANGETRLDVLTAQVQSMIEERGLDVLTKFGARKYPAFLARPRTVDIAAAVNRFRGLEIRS